MIHDQSARQRPERTIRLLGTLLHCEIVLIGNRVARLARVAKQMGC